MDYSRELDNCAGRIGTSVLKPESVHSYTACSCGWRRYAVTPSQNVDDHNCPYGGQEGNENADLPASQA
jgi:hypothetical protein